MENLVEYNIWKVTGYGRKKTRYFETAAWFNKIWERAKKDAEAKAYRFTSEGWEEIS